MALWATEMNNKHPGTSFLGTGDDEAESSAASSVAVLAVHVGPGMGGSAVQLIGVEGAQHFATQPTPQTAVVGSTAVLPCR